jgi:hypothetical protein
VHNQKSTRRLLMDILEETHCVSERLGELMAKFDDVKAVLDAIPPVIDAIAADQATLVDEIKALKDGVGSGTVVTEAQLQELQDLASAIKARLDSVDASVPAPVVP